uniref:Uncharacterized protein n=1 Tax=Acrobeloides nanus TaxID=290746 RepID=A0A914E0L6_9BILA
MKLSPRRFGDAQLEQVYARQQLHQHRPLLQHILCVLTAGLLLLAVNHLPNPDLVLILATVSSAFALGLQAYLLFKVEIGSQQKAVIISATWMCLTVICMLPAGGPSALLPTIIVYFTFYTMFPFELLTTILLGSILSLLQIISFIQITPNPFFSADQGQRIFECGLQ